MSNILFYLLLAFVGYFGTIFALKGLHVVTQSVSRKIPASLGGMHSSLMMVTLFCWGLSVLSIALYDGPVD